MENKVMFLDGALGTSLWEMSNTDGNTWELNITHSDIVHKLHKRYIDAGSQVITSNTFSINALSASETKYAVGDIVKAGVRIAKQAVAETDVKVAFDIGPLHKLLEPFGELSQEQCKQIYTEIIESGVQENPDLIFFETFMDIEMLKIAVSVASKYDLPMFCSMTFSEIGKTIMGNSVEDMINELKGYNIQAIGLNCSLDPSQLIGVIKTFREKTDLPLIFKPNAGLPQQIDGKVLYKSDEDIFVQDMIPAMSLAPIYIGGCCGTNPNYITKLKQAYKNKYTF